MNSKNTQAPADNTINAALNDLIAQVQNEKIRGYIVTGLMPQMEWYSREGRKCKKRYFRWTMVAISSSVLIPVESVFADGSRRAGFIRPKGIEENFDNAYYFLLI